MIRSFTPAITEIYSLISTDIGRPLERFVPLVKDMPPLPDPKSLATERSIEHTVVADSGKSYIRRVFPYQSHTGEFEGIVVTFSDVSQLRESQDLFKLLVEASAQIVWITNAHGFVEEDSPSWRAFTGQTIEQWIGHGWVAAIHPDDRERTLTQWAKVVKTKGVLSIEYRLRHHSGQYRWTQVNAVAQRNSDGSIRRWVGMNTDIDVQKRAEHELVESKDKLSDAKARLDLSLEISGVATWNWNMETNDVISNPALNRMFGFEEDETLTVSDFIAQMDEAVRSRITIAIEEAVKNGSTYDEEYPIRLRDGSIRHIRAVGKVSPAEDSKPPHFFGVTLDVTERKKREIDIVQREAHLRRVIDNQLGLVGVLQTDGILLEANATAFHAAGLTRDEVIGKPFWDCYWFSHDDAVVLRLKQALKQVLKGHTVRYDEEIRVAGDGRMTIDFMIRPVVDTHGQITHMIPSAVDISARKTMELALRESENRFRAMADGLPLLIWVHDHEGKQVAVNRAFCEFYQVKEEQMRDMEWHRFAHPDDFDQYTKEFARCVEERCPFHAEVRVKRADGQWRWLESWGQPHFSDTQGYRGHIGASADITDRKWQEFHTQFIADLQVHLDQLSTSEEIAAAATEKVFHWFKPSRCSLIQLVAESTIAEVFGEKRQDGLASSLGSYALSDFMGISELEILGSDLPLVFNDIHQSTLSTAEVQRYEAFGTRALLVIPYVSSGELKFALSIDFDRPRAWETHEVELMKDVTQRLYLRLQRSWAEERTRELASQLRESNERLELATSAAKMGMFDWNIDTDENIWDEQHLELTGLRNVPHSGQNFISCIHPEDLASNNEAINRAIQHGADYSIEFRFSRPDGQLRWLAARGRVIQGVDNCRHFVGLNWDVTDSKTMEMSLQHARDIADAANASKSEFLANMSHEIRTPMTAILGYAELLCEHVQSDEARKHINTIRRNGGYLLEIINDILDLSKIEAGKLDVDIERFEPARVVEDVRSIMEVRAKECGLNLDVKYETKIPKFVESDAKRLKQILINLVGNAIKFTNEGAVSIAVRLDDNASRPQLRFSISDTGIGMSVEQQQRLFKPFSQGDSIITQQFGGTGLGLAISQRLASMLDGEIFVESELNQGSTFTFTISIGELDNVALVIPGKFVEPTHPDSVPREIPINTRILVVDDRRDIRFLSNHILTSAGGKVEEAEDGVLAIQTVTKATTEGIVFDLILLDMQMPNMDGYETAKELRKIGYSGPIIALTADAMQGDMNRCIECGCNDYLSKPINKAKLLEKVSEMLHSMRS